MGIIQWVWPRRALLKSHRQLCDAVTARIVAESRASAAENRASTAELAAESARLDHRKAEILALSTKNALDAALIALENALQLLRRAGLNI